MCVWLTIRERERVSKRGNGKASWSDRGRERERDSRVDPCRSFSAIF